MISLPRSYIAVTMICCLLLGGTVAANPSPRSETVLIDLIGVDNDQLQHYKQLDGVAWWLEAGNVLLLAGELPRLREQIEAQRWLAEPGLLGADELALHARGCNDRYQTPNPESLILSGETHDLVRKPRSFSSLPVVQDVIDPALGAPLYEAVSVNSVIARMHRLDRSGGALPVDPGIVPIVAAVDSQRWFDDVVTLAEFDRSSYSAELPVARQWLATQFASLGLSVSEPEFVFPFSTPAPVANVIGFWTGTHTPEQWIIVGGHYDSRNAINNAANASNTPGADDNASGCSGVLEAARAILPFRPRLSVMFMCYAGEEQGLHGSARHVDALIAAGDLQRVQAMLNMDMIGWTPDQILGVQLGLRTDVGDGPNNLALAQRLADAALSYVPAMSPDHIIIRTTSCCSDHMPYLNAGLPALLSIHRGTTGYPHYHRTTDIPINLGANAQQIGGAIIRMNVAALAELSGASDSIFADGLQ